MTDLAVSRSILAQPGTGAFLVIFGMAVILFFVFRSMAKHLRKVNMAARADAEAKAKAQAAAEAQESQWTGGASNGRGGTSSSAAPGGAGRSSSSGRDQGS